MGDDDYVIDGDLAFSNKSTALKFYQDEYHKKKEWVGLTDKEISEAWFTGEPYDKVVRMLEALLKDKNS